MKKEFMMPFSKKEYIMPDLTVMEIETQATICASTEIGDEGDHEWGD